jgi:hypothetical protein
MTKLLQGSLRSRHPRSYRARSEGVNSSVSAISWAVFASAGSIVRNQPEEVREELGWAPKLLSGARAVAVKVHVRSGTLLLAVGGGCESSLVLTQTVVCGEAVQDELLVWSSVNDIEDEAMLLYDLLLIFASVPIDTASQWPSLRDHSVYLMEPGSSSSPPGSGSHSWPSERRMTRTSHISGGIIA